MPAVPQEYLNISFEDGGPGIAPGDPAAPLRRIYPSRWSRARTIEECWKLFAENTGCHYAVMDGMNRHNCWRDCFERIAARPPNREAGDRLMAFWMGNGLTTCEYGIGRALKDDIAVFADALRRHLPPYEGPGMTLYRGQLEALHLAGMYGIAWTSRLEAAERLATHHSWGEGPGVVLRIEATAQMIVSSPTRHSSEIMEEDEYIIDPRGIQPIVLKTLPPH